MARIFLLFIALSASAQVTISPSFNTAGPVTIGVSPGSAGRVAITAHPYSGDRTSETILADNTHMSRSLAREFRDSQGRMRIEHSGQGYGSLTIVEIEDPVAGFDWVLDPANQVAYRLPLQMKQWAGAPKPTPCDPGSPATTQTVGNGTVSASEPLGSKQIEGIEACGRRITMTQKDGRPGVASELWTSRESIGGILLTKLRDGRGGETVTQLVNIKFSEPEPNLFLPPVGYKVVPQSGNFAITDSSVKPAVETAVTAAPRASRKIVALTGLPWSGELLSGETVINRQYRDSSGRTRREPVATNGPAEIVDPVAGYSYTLDSATQTAQRRKITAQSQPASAAKMEVGDGGPHTTDLPRGVKGLIEALGTKTIDGVTVVGTRVTLTYPPGTMSGNTTTTSTVNEAWHAPQLGATLEMRSAGALVPNSTTTLGNLKYSEPDAALFRVPDGYKIIDEE